MARLEAKPEGGAPIVASNGPDKGWVPAFGAVDAEELLTLLLATNRLMTELGTAIATGSDTGACLEPSSATDNRWG